MKLQITPLLCITLIITACSNMPASVESPRGVLSAQNVALNVPIGAPRRPTTQEAPGTATLICKIAGRGFGVCRVIAESRQGLGNRAKILVQNWEVRRPVPYGANVELEIIFTDAHCVAVARTTDPLLKCIPY